MKTLKVQTSNCSYNVYWSLENEFSDIVRNYQKNYSHNILITNQTIYSIYSSTLLDIFVKDKILFVKDSEKSKSLSTIEELANAMINQNYDRNICIWSFGGGVVGDITGFIASVYMRGVAYVQIPTTLLSMVDSSVGGKTAVNLQSAKNIIGTFYQPAAVIICVNFLQSLPAKEIRAGISEILKSAIIFNKELFQYIQNSKHYIQNHDISCFSFLSQESIAIKSQIVQQDEKETSGFRSILNFGHTLAHALESYQSYNEAINHGEAVSIGMGFASYFSYKKGLLPKNEWEQIKNIIIDLNLPLSLSSLCKKNDSKEQFIQSIISYMKKDKKNNHSIQYVFITSIGSCNLPVEEKEENIYNNLLDYMELIP